MDEETKGQLKEFFKICYSRLEKGDKEHAGQYENIDLFWEITEELADIANYAFLEYVKLLKLRKKVEDKYSLHQKSKDHSV